MKMRLSYGCGKKIEGSAWSHLRKEGGPGLGHLNGTSRVVEKTWKEQQQMEVNA